MLKLIGKFLMICIVTISIPILLWGAGFVVFTASIYYMTEPAATEAADGAIVLTGGSNRVSKGLDLLADKRISNLLVSGVHKNVKIKDLVKQWDRKNQEVPCCVTLGREAGDTIGNATEAKKWIEEGKLQKVFVITANYHMPRALVEFNHQIPGVKIIPFPIQPENFDPREDIFWRIDFKEYHKLIMTMFRILVYPNETNAFPEALKTPPTPQLENTN